MVKGKSSRRPGGARTRRPAVLGEQSPRPVARPVKSEEVGAGALSLPGGMGLLGRRPRQQQWCHRSRGMHIEMGGVGRGGLPPRSGGRVMAGMRGGRRLLCAPSEAETARRGRLGAGRRLMAGASVGMRGRGPVNGTDSVQSSALSACTCGDQWVRLLLPACLPASAAAWLLLCASAFRAFICLMLMAGSKGLGVRLSLHVCSTPYHPRAVS